MADVSVRNSNKNSATGATSITVTAPTGTTTADIVVIAVSCNNTVTLSDNNGATPFTKDYQGGEGTNGWTFAIFSRRIQGGDPASYSFAQDGAATRMGIIAVTFQNPNASSIYDVAPSATTEHIQTTGTSNTAVDPVTTINNSIACAVATWDNLATVITPPSNGEGGFTEQQNQALEQTLSFITKTITPARQPNIGTFTSGVDTGSGTVSFVVANTATVALTVDVFDAPTASDALLAIRLFPVLLTVNDLSVVSDVIFVASATLVQITVNDAPTATEVISIFPTGLFAVFDTAIATDGGIAITYEQSTLAPSVFETSVMDDVVGGIRSLQSRDVSVFDNTFVNTGFADISWNANTEPDLAGYKIYQGTTTGVYDTVYDVGLTDTPATPRYVVWDLVFGTQYFFVVTAYDTSNNESLPSSEVSKTPTDVLLGLVHLSLGVLFVFEDSTLTDDALQVMMPVRPALFETVIPVTEGLALLRPFNATAVGDTMAVITESTTITLTTQAGLSVSTSDAPTATDARALTFTNIFAVHDDPTVTENQTVRMSFYIPLTTTFDASAPVDTGTSVVVRLVLSGGLFVFDTPLATDARTVQMSLVLLAVSDSILLSDGPFDYSPQVGARTFGRLTNITGTSPETVLT